MAMEAVLDSVRRIVLKWVDTTSRIQSDVAAGDTTVCVKNARRFYRGDEVMLKNNQNIYESNLFVQEIDEGGLVTLTTPVLNNWQVSDDTVLIKAIHGQFIQGVHIGEPEVLGPKFPQITVNGVSRSSEWMTLESTKERYEIEIGVYVQAAAREEGYRFLMKVTDAIQQGLKMNLQPLVADYDITSLTQDAAEGDLTLYLAERSLVQHYRRIIIEDEYEAMENWVTHLYAATEDPTGQAVRIKDPMNFSYTAATTSVVVPKRFIFNSWPHNIQYGTVHKGELLKASKISWFAEEEESQFLRRQELKLN
jgi:hypothetical protein